MNYSGYTKEQLIEVIEELQMLNKELLAEKENEIKLDFAWAGNLGHWYFNIKTGTVVFNPLKVLALGYAMDELPDKVPYQFFTSKIHPEDYQNAMDAMLLAMAAKAPVYECEYRIQTKEGRWKWFYDRGNVTQRSAEGKAEFAAGIVFDITEKKEQELLLAERNELLKTQAKVDPLTGVMNRKTILEELEIKINHSISRPSNLSIAMFDIDNFKKLNDTKGHIFGDKVLKEVAQIIAKAIREPDLVGRYGGEEFLVIFPNTTKPNAESVCDRIRLRVESHVFDEDIMVTISGGVAEYAQMNVPDFIDAADKKLYVAKNSGRNRIES